MAVALTVVGLGYVGLPLVQEACRSGMKVTGLDVNPVVVMDLTNGVSHVDDVDGDDVAEMKAAGFVATTEPDCVEGSDVVVICVPTPLNDDNAPDLSSVIAATRTVAAHLSRGALVVLESTTYPGTTEQKVGPLLEEGSGLTAGVDFNLAYSPERIDPGNREWWFRNTPKVVGGLTKECAERAVEFYEKIVDTVVPTVGLSEAEFAKLLENTYRYVNIALVNEMAVFCHELGIDLWAAIDAAKTKPFGFEAFYPGPGVGGHCIPIDPNFLSWVVRSLGSRFRLVELSQEVSTRMPRYIVKRVQDALNKDLKAVNGSNILLLGVTYKANLSDQRGTPARPVAAQLLDMGAEVYFFDPYVDLFPTNGKELSCATDLSDAINQADLVVLLQAHDQIIQSTSLTEARRILDTRGALSGDNVERL